MNRYEDFPIEEQVIEQFLKVNSSIWKAKQKKKKYIYVNLSMVRMQMAWIIPKLLFAKGISERTGMGVVVITWRPNPLLTKLFSSFGFIHYCIEKENRKHPMGLLWGMLKTISFMMHDGTGEGLERWKIKDLNVGAGLYEDIIRTSDFSTIRSARNIVCAKKIIHLLWMLFSLDKYISSHLPAYVVADDCAYHESIQSSFFSKYGAKVYNCSLVDCFRIPISKRGTVMRRGMLLNYAVRKQLPRLGETEVKLGMEYLAGRFSGMNGRDIDRGAFQGKTVLGRDQILQEYKLDENKKTAVIMAHTFTDAVFNYGKLYFRDYYDWMEKTLQIASENTDVNWVLKPHPTRSVYHETADSIERMFERHKKDHMALLADSVSAESIKNIADVIITIGGNAGAEFACFGIPAIIVGKPYYQGFGYTYEPSSIQEYTRILNEVGLLPPLTEEQKKIAAKVFYLQNNKGMALTGHRFADKFAVELKQMEREAFDKVALQLFESNVGTEGDNSRMTEWITEYFENNDIRECEYYRMGWRIGNAK